MTKSRADAQRKEKLRERLVREKRELLADIRKAMGNNLGEEVRMYFEISQDNADRSVDELRKHVDATIVGYKSEMLDAVDEALNSLELGTYGVCERCGCDIPVRRLQAVPFAACCVDCQEAMDMEKKSAAAAKPERYTANRDSYGPVTEEE